MRNKRCTWKVSNDLDNAIYETGCGESFIFFEGCPATNNFLFCPYCGEIIDDLSDTDNDKSNFYMIIPDF